MTRLTLLTTAAATALVVNTARADLAVWVGYADNLRPSGFFPNPWCSGGGPLCQVKGDAPHLDSGAIRIDNLGGTDQLVDHLAVLVNHQIFAVWSPVTIHAGERAIFAQTTDEENFDTSDLPFLPFSIGTEINGVGGCSVQTTTLPVAPELCRAFTPTIQFSANGRLFSVTDDGHVLDTGGFDLALVDVNESIGWHRTGTAIVNRENSNIPEPSTGWIMLLPAIALGALRKFVV